MSSTELSPEQVAVVVRCQSLYRRKQAIKQLARRKKFVKERANIAREVIKTERVYSTILSHIVNVFLNPLKESNLIKDGVLTEENRRKIFPGALATLSQVHKDFFNALEKRVAGWGPHSKIGDLFLDMNPYFKLYPVYVSDFENQLKALKEAKHNERFWEFIKGGFQVLKDPSNDLPSLLITPVQRIPRYLMLVQQLLKYTWPEHVDYKDIQSAATQLGKIADYVDQKAKDAENVQKMHHVQEILLGKYDTLMDPQRRFVSQGLVYEVRGKDVRLMGLFQFSDMVVWAKVKKVEKKVESKKGEKKKKETTTVMEYHYQTRIPLMNCSLSGVEDQSKTIRNCFVLRTPEKNYLIATESSDSKRDWMQNLNQSIQEVNRKAATLRKQVAIVEEKKATMRQVRQAEKAEKELTAEKQMAALMADVPALETKSAVKAPKRSGWLLKRAAKEEKKEMEKAAAAAATAERTSQTEEMVLAALGNSSGGDLEDSQSEEVGSGKLPRTSRERASLTTQRPKGFRGGTTRGGVVSRSTTADIAPPAPLVVPSTEEKKHRRLRFGKKDRSRPRSESSTEQEDEVEQTMNIGAEDISPRPDESSSSDSRGSSIDSSQMPLRRQPSVDDVARIRRGSRILKLDDLPTFDGHLTGDDQMGELKAAYDRLEEPAQQMQSNGTEHALESPGRRRSLSAPELPTPPIIRSPGPPSYMESSEEEDEGETDSEVTPIKITDARPPGMDLRKWNRLRTLKRGSVGPVGGSRPGIDTLSALGKSVPEGLGSGSWDFLLRSASASDIKRSASVSEMGSSTGVEVAKEKTAKEEEEEEPPPPAGSKTPPRPRRTAPLLGTALAPDVVCAPSPSVTEKEVLRKASSVVMEGSDDEDSTTPVKSRMSSVASVAEQTRTSDDAVNGSGPPEQGSEPANELEDAELIDDVGNDDNISHSDDLGSEPGADEDLDTAAVVVDDTPFSSGEVTAAIPSGEATPSFPRAGGSNDPSPRLVLAFGGDLGASSSGEVTPKMSSSASRISAPPPVKTIDGEVVSGVMPAKAQDDDDDDDDDNGADGLANDADSFSLSSSEEDGQGRGDGTPFDDRPLEDKSSSDIRLLVSPLVMGVSAGAITPISQEKECSFSVSAVPDNIMDETMSDDGIATVTPMVTRVKSDDLGNGSTTTELTFEEEEEEEDSSGEFVD